MHFRNRLPLKIATGKGVAMRRVRRIAIAAISNEQCASLLAEGIVAFDAEEDLLSQAVRMHLLDNQRQITGAFYASLLAVYFATTTEQ